ncbi:UNVERIFIED_CONTAM: Mediator of RNA polymerase II transcription subunit [Sesamum radiatum]|uniref:Mediator of RNA polymerase II transcription subunit 21 n=1 Tax=Sesamum radiatum TaxID=300843 RepID=A0AAW2T327_SESRA
MDIISQLQEQVNTIASLAFNTFGTLQRDAPPVQLSPNYPEPPANATGVEDPANLAEQPKLLSAELVKAAKQFDALVAALPLSEGGEEAQLKRIAELQAENDAIGQGKATGSCRILFTTPKPWKLAHQVLMKIFRGGESRILIAYVVYSLNCVLLV